MILNKNRIIFILILFIAVVLRFFYLSHDSLYEDEPAYLVRSMGWHDSLGSNLQSTPAQWFDSVPWWSNLSFHDHPPLVFAVNKVSFSLFGDSLFVGRLPSATFSLLTVVLIFLIASKLFDRQTGLIAMFIFSVNDFVLVYARRGMMESISLFFILLTLYFFILALKNKKYLYLFGVGLGLSLLAKYVSLFMVPVYLLTLIIYKRDYLVKKELYYSLLIAVVIFSPVLLYNYYLYITVGHFDLQFSYLFGQDTPQWSSLIGKENIGGLQNRISNWKHLFFNFSIPMSIVTLASIVFTVWRVKSKKYKKAMNYCLMLFSFISLFLLTLVIGSDDRFIYYSLPFLFIMISCFLSHVLSYKKNSKLVFIVIVIFAVYESFFSINTNIVSALTSPIGLKHVMYSSRSSSDSDKYQLLDKFVQETSKTNSYIIFDPRIQPRAYLWTFARRQFYENKTFFTTYNLLTEMENIAKNHSGQIKFYYIHTGNKRELSETVDAKSVHPDNFANSLLGKKIKPTIIKDKAGNNVYAIFEFDVTGTKEN